MTPTETLMHEHEVILLVLDGAQKEAERIRETGSVDADRVGEMLDFFRTFADKCHHAKEERILFARMSELGMPTESGPITVMLHEHDLGRARLKAISEALPDAVKGDRDQAEVVADNLAGYVELLRNHIRKENEILFPIADKMLTPEDQTFVNEAFDRIEAEEMGLDTHERYHELAHKLAA